jgi:hypothetical protein
MDLPVHCAAFPGLSPLSTRPILGNEVGLEVNAEKTKYMLPSHHQSAGQNHEIKIANRCFENVAQFRYLGTTITNT